MNAIILAAGQGTRLLPSTNNIPKAMLEFAGKTLLERLIETFRRCGIHDISIVTGHKGETINFPKIKYFRNSRYAETNMLESLFCAKEKINDSVIISYADIIFQDSILTKLIESSNDVSLLVDTKWKEIWKIRVGNPINDANETVELDQNNFIKKIGHKVQKIEQVDGHFIGLMKVQNRGINFLREIYEKNRVVVTKNYNPLNPNLSFEKSRLVDLIQAIINDGCKVKAIPIEKGWLEFDTKKDFEIYNKIMKDNLLSNFISLGKV